MFADLRRFVTPVALFLAFTFSNSALAQSNLKVVGWNVVSGDSKPQTLAHRMRTFQGVASECGPRRPASYGDPRHTGRIDRQGSLAIRSAGKRTADVHCQVPRLRRRSAVGRVRCVRPGRGDRRASRESDRAHHGARISDVKSPLTWLLGVRRCSFATSGAVGQTGKTRNVGSLYY
jgi:hypothetical protein